jgi:hypothetical protein
MTTIDLSKFEQDGGDEYERQIRRVNTKTGFIASIEATTKKALDFIKNGAKSFVIYGEPQSGKTEMMICLTARLLDAGYRHIIVLINDNVDLQNQNLLRFRRSKISPAPQSLQDIRWAENPLKPNISSIIFCKKNKDDLEKLIAQYRKIDRRVIIDDEADFATPNSKVNKDEQSRINQLVEELRNSEHGGIYIGVTATPSRLDLNNTFENEKENWCYFEPYPDYSGHKTFFPSDGNYRYELIELPDEGDNPQHLRIALTRFVVNVAYLNLMNRDGEQNYCMLVHTSGLRDDHSTDREIVEKYFEELEDKDNKNHARRYDEIHIDAERYSIDPSEIVRYVYRNRSRKAIKVINSAQTKNSDNIRGATDPDTPFTVAIGGNIISRGVTFNNLLSMFFTRNTKKELQQDTYIQRARMFGNRSNYLPYFELHIPKTLYRDWYQAFELHGLAMGSIPSGKPVWLESKRIRTTSRTSIDRDYLTIDSGEISFDLFPVNNSLLAGTQTPIAGYDNFYKILSLLPENYISEHVLQFVESRKRSEDASIVFHASRQIKNSENIDEENITRAKGLFGGQDYEETKFPSAIHHFKVFYNDSKNARVVYSYRENDRSIRFLRMNRRTK